MDERKGWLKALEAAYYGGYERVTHGDRTVQYRSVEDLLAAIKRLRRALGMPPLEGYRRGRSTRVGRFTKGL